MFTRLIIRNSPRNRTANPRVGGPCVSLEFFEPQLDGVNSTGLKRVDMRGVPVE